MVFIRFNYDMFLAANYLFDNIAMPIVTKLSTTYPHYR